MKRLMTIILAIILIISMTACSVTHTESYGVPVVSGSRFRTIERSDVGWQFDSDVEYRILVDSETDIVYIMAMVPQGNATYGGLTPLLNEDGEPMTIDEYRRIR